MTRLKNTFLAVIGLLLAFSCGNKFSKPDIQQSNDIISNQDTFTFNFNLKDSLFGKYHFVIHSGYSGRTLILNSDFTYIEYAWSDLELGWPFRKKKHNGKWKVSGSKVILKKGYKRISLRIHQYSWETFLVPEEMAKTFALRFNDKKYLIDSMSNNIGQASVHEVDEVLHDFRRICFMKQL